MQQLPIPYMQPQTTLEREVKGKFITSKPEWDGPYRIADIGSRYHARVKEHGE